MGPSTIQGELIALSEELASGKLVKNLTLFPSLQITLVHPDMTREFEHACQVLYRYVTLFLRIPFYRVFYAPIHRSQQSHKAGLACIPSRNILLKFWHIDGMESRT